MPFSERKGYFAKLILNQTVLIPLFFFLCTIALPSAFAETVNLAWDPSTGSNIAGYKMYYGTASKNYSYNVNVGKSTSCSLSGLTAGKKYYFAATAYNTSNAESSYSSEISYTVPTSSTSSSTTSGTSSSSSTSSTPSSSGSTSTTTPTSPTSSTTTSGFTADYDSSQTVFAFEAEDGDIHNAMVTAGDSKASSGTYILVPNGGGSNGYAAYTFQVTSAGNYVVWGRALAPNGYDDSFYVSMDGGSNSLWVPTRSTNWVWDKVSNDKVADPVFYNLSTGKHTLTIKQREDGTKLDCVVITKNSSSAPSTSIFNGTPSSSTSSSTTSGTSSTSSTSSTPSSSGSTTESVNADIEAEDGIMSGPMERAADNNASSGMYVWVRNGGGSGGSAKYTFEVTKAGKYIIWGRVLAPNGYDDSFYVSMDGGADALWATTRSTTWVWDKVSNDKVADPVFYTLSTGKHTLTIKQREDGTKLDKFIITDNLNLKP